MEAGIESQGIAGAELARDPALRRAVGWAGGLNLGWFAVEFVAALAIGSVALFADSIDFLEDAAVNFLILVALGWSMRARARLGMALAALILVPALATLWTAVQKLAAPVAPDPLTLSAVAASALVINGTAALILARVRHRGGSLGRAAFLSARNDMLANLGIIGAGIVTATLWHSAWPDLIVGLAIAALNADAAREVWNAARAEARAARP